jgi:hypothetical protein
MNNLNTRLDKAMSTEQFTQVVDAILDGKYSWACVLILRFAGYNPLHYIPYRTYNRLMKDNRSNHAHQSSNFSKENHSNTVSDLNFIELLEEDCSHIQGGITAHSYSKNHWEWVVQTTKNSCQTGNL